jgi:threonyl-tRNA synthetase
MIKVSLPDGSVKEFEKNSTPMDVAKSISEGLARNVISASYNGSKVETTTTLTTDGSLVLYTWNDKEGKKAFWHSTSHVMAQVLEEKYPGIKLTLGPAIDNGFYYDVDFGDTKITEADFKAIEDRVLEIAREKHVFKMRPVSKSEAMEIYKNNEYKTELISNLEDGTITFCDHSNFFDLCRGGHIPNTGLIKAMKIMSVAGAYWRGDEKNKQLTRVYGISFPKQKDLTDYLELLEEANGSSFPKYR